MSESPVVRTDVAAEKAALRSTFRARRDALSTEYRAAASAQITERLIALPAWRAAGCVFTFVGIGSEVDTSTIRSRALSSGKRVLLPRVLTGGAHGRRTMVAIDDPGDALLERSRFGVLEPPLPATEDGSFDRRVLDARAVGDLAGDGAKVLVVVPGLVFDDRGFRIGYGGGFYDQLLADERLRRAAVGVCFSEQRCSALPTESFDIPVAFVVANE